ncbi:MAG: hypothetical protein PVI90_16590 [Desulfobacteraceae bacterium]|jgi:hypothetical protein
METASITPPLLRITDLVDAKTLGAKVHLEIAFEILPVDFQHHLKPFQAYIFLAKYTGSVDELAFAFRKCYARGCHNNLCSHVSQAVRIANRYLQRDYHTLKSNGIMVEEILFSLDRMMIEFDHLKEDGPPQLTIPELIAMAKTGDVMNIEVELELIPAVEHFAGTKKAQTFLGGEFMAETKGGVIHCHRCFACYATDRAAEEKQTAIMVANRRLASIYNEFNQYGIRLQSRYFS